MAEAAGKVAVDETDKALKVTMIEPSGEEHSYSFPARTRLHVAHGEKVEAGQQLNEGSLFPADLLEIRGRTETELYLVREVQEVYRAQGVDINDKHIELIVRQMLKKVGSRQRAPLPCCRASSRTARASSASTRRSRTRAARRPRPRR